MESVVTNSYKSMIKNKGNNTPTTLDGFLQKALVVTMLAAASQSVYAGFKPLSAEEMGEVTGQAGLSMDIEPDVENFVDNFTETQAASVSVGVSMCGVFCAAYIAVGSMLGIASVGDYEEQLWSVDFVESAEHASEILSKWGATDTDMNSQIIFDITNVGTHGEVEQSLDTGDMLIHSGKSVHGVGTVSEGFEFSVSRSLIDGGGGGGEYEDINEVVKWGEWDLIFDLDNKEINLNVYIQAERDTVLDYLGMNVNVKVHNSRGSDKYIVGDANGDEAASFAHFQADIRSAEDSKEGGAHFNILDFSGDVDYANIAFNGSPVIGSVYITDFVIKADMHIYEH